MQGLNVGTVVIMQCVTVSTCFSFSCVLVVNTKKINCLPKQFYLHLIPNDTDNQSMKFIYLCLLVMVVIQS